MAESGDLDGIPFSWISEEKTKVINLSEDVLENQYSQSYRDNTRAAFKYEDTNVKHHKLKQYDISEPALEFLNRWVEKLTNKIDEGTLTLEELDIYLEVLRAFRNVAVTSSSQAWITDNVNLNRVAPTLFEHMVKVDMHHLGIRVLCQFLHNVITMNQRAVHKFEAMMKKIALRCYEMQVYEFECSALMYQMFLHERYYDLDLFTIMLDVFFERHNEFLHFLFTNCLKQKHFWKRLYPLLKIEHRLYFLQMVRHFQMQSGWLDSHSQCLRLCMKTFLKAGDVIFQTQNAEGSMKEAQEIAYMLEILSAVSSEIKWSHLFLDNDELLIHCSMLLINLHRLGKESNNCFTPVTRLADFGNADLEEHPAFCFKADLIRLIANLTYKRERMQDLARNAEVIPVILDCCNMDAKNPLIMQWCIIVIRNLCDGNIENQKLIGGLHKQGLVANELLTEMGITLNDDDDKPLTIIPIEGYSKRH